jgi:hypothetical protein
MDEMVPRKLRRELTECDVRTVQEEGWRSFKNGALLSRAQTDFDVFLSGDTNLEYQQNVARFDIGIVAIETVSLRLRDIMRAIDDIRTAVATVLPGELIKVEVPRPLRRRSRSGNS